MVRQERADIGHLVNFVNDNIIVEVAETFTYGLRVGRLSERSNPPPR